MPEAPGRIACLLVDDLDENLLVLSALLEPLRVEILTARSGAEALDVLFESAAEAFGPGALAILLTGGNEDGAAGVAAIREAGGIVVVQDPEEAYAPTMVEAALARGPVHHRLRLADIAGLLRGLAAEKRPVRD